MRLLNILVLILNLLETIKARGKTGHFILIATSRVILLIVAINCMDIPKDINLSHDLQKEPANITAINQLSVQDQSNFKTDQECD